MKIRPPFHLPADKQRDLDRLVRLEWWSLGFKISIVLVLFSVLGTSQAMRAAWYEDLLSLVPSIAFLVAMRIRNRPPDAEYPYGYQRVVVIAFLCAAVALVVIGLYVLYDSLGSLLRAEHPSIGAIELFGETVWMGWPMIAALTYSAIPPVIFGRILKPIAESVHEKTVYVDADTNKADWMTAVAGIVGILGVGFGFWWADAAAAVFIALDITWDGTRHLKEAVGDLADRRPRPLGGGSEHSITDELKARLMTMPWVEDAAVRLREEGHAFVGEAFVVPREEAGLVRHLQEATEELEAHDWRVYQIVITAVDRLE